MGIWLWERGFACFWAPQLDQEHGVKNLVLPQGEKPQRMVQPQQVLCHKAVALLGAELCAEPAGLWVEGGTCGFTSAVVSLGCFTAHSDELS